MSAKANPAVVGIFVMTAIVLIVVSVFLFGTRQFFKQKDYFILYFDESVNGLDEGTAVKFKGVDVGRVNDILIYYDAKKRSAYIPVIIETVEKELPFQERHSLNLHDPEALKNHIANGLRASLVLQSYLTGKLYVELDYYSPKDYPAEFVPIPSKYRQIPTIKSDLQEIWKAAADVFMKLRKIDFEAIANHVESIAKKIDDGLGDFNLQKLQDSFTVAMDSVTKVANDIDSKVDPLSESAQEALKEAREAFNSLENAAGSIGDIIEPDSSFRVEWDETLDEIKRAARSIRNLTDYLERNPNALLAGKKFLNK